MENIREFLNWLVNEPEYNIAKDEIQEILDDYGTFKNSLHPDESPKVSTNEQAKEYFCSTWTQCTHKKEVKDKCLCNKVCRYKKYG